MCASSSSAVSRPVSAVVCVGTSLCSVYVFVLDCVCVVLCFLGELCAVENRRSQFFLSRGVHCILARSDENSVESRAEIEDLQFHSVVDGKRSNDTK